MRRLALLLAFHATSAQQNHLCDLTPQTVARINDWILNGHDPGDNAFEALRCAAATTVGSAVGGIGGGAAGTLLANKASRKVSAALCGDGTNTTCHGVASAATRVLGGLLGYVVGAATGAEASHRYFGRGSFFGSPSRAAAIKECAELFGVEPDAGAGAVDRAYKARTLRDHPDKGGSTEAMARLNVCRAVLQAHAARREL